MPDLRIVVDDLTGRATLDLAALHLRGMHDLTPPESVHALGIEELRHPSVTLWSAWVGDELAGIGALKRLGDGDGEIKSMRVADAHLGTGVGRALVRHIVAEARRTGLRALWLETGSDAGFAAARGLYVREGFVVCEPFGTYRPGPLSTFMTLAL